MADFGARLQMSYKRLPRISSSIANRSLAERSTSSRVLVSSLIGFRAVTLMILGRNRRAADYCAFNKGGPKRTHPWVDLSPPLLTESARQKAEAQCRFRVCTGFIWTHGNLFRPAMANTGRTGLTEVEMALALLQKAV